MAPADAPGQTDPAAPTHWLDQTRTPLFREHPDCPPSDEAPKVKAATFVLLACIFLNGKLLLCKRSRDNEWEIPMLSIDVSPTDEIEAQLALDSTVRRDNGDSISDVTERYLRIILHPDAFEAFKFLEDNCPMSKLKIQQRYADAPIVAMLPVVLAMERMPERMFKEGSQKYCGLQWYDEQESVNQLFTSQSFVEDGHVRHGIFARYRECCGESTPQAYPRGGQDPDWVEPKEEEEEVGDEVLEE